jgi:hypothetical protein
MHDTGTSDIRDSGGWGADSAELTQFDPGCQWVTTDYRVGINPIFTLGKQLLNVIGNLHEVVELYCKVTIGYDPTTRPAIC